MAVKNRMLTVLVLSSIFQANVWAQEPAVITDLITNDLVIDQDTVIKPESNFTPNNKQDGQSTIRAKDKDVSITLKNGVILNVKKDPTYTGALASAGNGTLIFNEVNGESSLILNPDGTYTDQGGVFGTAKNGKLQVNVSNVEIKSNHVQNLIVSGGENAEIIFGDNVKTLNVELLAQGTAGSISDVMKIYQGGDFIFKENSKEGIFNINATNIPRVFHLGGETESSNIIIGGAETNIIQKNNELDKTGYLIYHENNNKERAPEGISDTVKFGAVETNISTDFGIYDDCNGTHDRRLKVYFTGDKVNLNFAKGGAAYVNNTDIIFGKGSNTVTSNNYSYGFTLLGSTLEADGSIYIKHNNNEDAYAVWARHNDDSRKDKEPDTFASSVMLKGKSIIEATSAESNAYGVYLQKSEKNLAGNYVLNTMVSEDDITISSQAEKGNAVGLYASGYEGLEDVQADFKGANNVFSAVGASGMTIKTKYSKVNIGVSKIGYNEISFDGDAGAAVNADYNSDIEIGTNGSTNIIGVTGTKAEALSAGNNSVIGINGSRNEITGLVHTLGASVGDTSAINITGISNDIISKTTVKDNEESFLSAIHSESAGNGSGSINITAGDGGLNIIGTDGGENVMERAVWAKNGTINITGQSQIYASNSLNLQANKIGIALAAGSGSKTSAEKGTVNAHLGSGSTIWGDVMAGYGGTVNVNGGGKTGIGILGNVLAANGGSVNVHIGSQGQLVGRADSYMNAGGEHGGVYFNPKFGKEIESSGTVNITLGDKSVWSVTGQTWADSVIMGKDAVIDMVKINIDKDAAAHAMTIGRLEGDAKFVMSLDGDRDISDMLYIKESNNGEYQVELVDVVTTDDMYASGYDGLRFATIGDRKDAKFTVTAKNKGFYNVVYTVATDAYDNNSENSGYNGSAMTEHKPGDAAVDKFFARNEEQGTPESEAAGAENSGAKKMMRAARYAAAPAVLNDTAGEESVNEESGIQAEEPASENTGATNYKLVGMNTVPVEPEPSDPSAPQPSLPKPELSDIGRTIMMQAQANYKNAVYMDRLNKRLGEARYVNEREDIEKDEGVWVRLRHDRIGMDNSFRSKNTMYELGYDKKQECDNGEHRFGAAFDYMRGDTEYSNIYGKGEIKRAGLWFYDTWMGEKGHYTDYVAKWGHLDNEFDIMAGGEKVTGDYTNNVFSLSAEYGRKKDMGRNWYVEPQAQLQFAHVTSADYVTSQGTRMELDGINSLIGRLGFRLGKDYGTEKKSTVYLKADVLHEFMGDQDVRAFDKTTDNRWSSMSFRNKGTWYDVGFGFAAETGKNSYMYMDFEKSFGNGNEDTYQINAGMQWSF